MPTDKSEDVLDVLIIGGGPIGIACALSAQKKDLNYVVIEKGTLVNSLYHYPTNMTFFSTSEKLEIGGIPFISNNPKPRKAEALEYYRRIVTSNELNINLFEKVVQVTKSADFFQVKTAKANYLSKKIVIATGFYDIPNYLNVPGEDLPKVFHYYNDPHYFSGMNVVVVGASNSSVDAALEVYRKGGNVSMVVRNKAIGERVKYWVKPDIENRINEGSIKAYFNSEITAIHPDSVDVQTKSGENFSLENDFVLALTGYRPNFEFLKKLGIQLSEDGRKIPSYNDETMETNVSGIYLAGVICGGTETHKWFIENSRIHAPMIMEDIADKIKK